MQVLGILSAHQRHGITGQLLDATLQALPANVQTKVLFLADYQITPDTGQVNPVLDQLEQLLQASDIWIMASPTYWGSLSGTMKNFLDCMRPRMVRMTSKADTLPGQFKHKHYLSLTTCFITSCENFFVGITDDTFRVIDRALTSAGLIKITELVATGTWQQKYPTAKQLARCQTWGRKIATRQVKDDATLKRYLQLLGMVAAMALVTMGLQQLIFKLFTWSTFWLAYFSFVVIFYVLLASILHYFTFLRHRRR